MKPRDRIHISRPGKYLARWFAVLAFILAGATAAHGAGRVELLMFESSTCEWCDLWRAEIGPVYPKTDEGKIAPLRVISIHAEQPADLKAINGIVYTPTFVLWDGQREIGRILGYSGEIQFWGLLEVLLRKLKDRKPAPAEALPVNRKNLRGTPVESSPKAAK
jgi:hypothetical protein